MGELGEPQRDARSVAVELQSLLLGADGVEPFLVEVARLAAGSVADALSCGISVQATPLTTQLLHAVGVAHAATLRGEDTVTLAMCGDGATSEGDFHEAPNFAAVFELPVIFLVQPARLRSESSNSGSQKRRVEAW